MDVKRGVNMTPLHGNVSLCCSVFLGHLFNYKNGIMPDLIILFH